MFIYKLNLDRCPDKLILQHRQRYHIHCFWEVICLLCLEETTQEMLRKAFPVLYREVRTAYIANSALGLALSCELQVAMVN